MATQPASAPSTRILVAPHSLTVGHCRSVRASAVTLITASCLVACCLPVRSFVRSFVRCSIEQRWRSDVVDAVEQWSSGAVEQWGQWGQWGQWSSGSGAVERSSKVGTVEVSVLFGSFLVVWGDGEREETRQRKASCPCCNLQTDYLAAGYRSRQKHVWDTTPAALNLRGSVADMDSHS